MQRWPGWQGQELSEKQSDQPAARNGIFAAGDWRAESASETISPRRDRKSETTTREKWPGGLDGILTTWTTASLASYPRNALGLRGRADHLGLQGDVERSPGGPQLHDKGRAELALKTPHQR